MFLLCNSELPVKPVRLVCWCQSTHWDPESRLCASLPSFVFGYVTLLAWNGHGGCFYAIKTSKCNESVPSSPDQLLNFCLHTIGFGANFSRFRSLKCVDSSSFLHLCPSEILIYFHHFKDESYASKCDSILYSNMIGLSFFIHIKAFFAFKLPL